MNGAAVLGHDARRDRQAETGSSVLRRKVREKKFVFVLGRDAVAGVGHANFDGFRIGMRASRDEYLAERRVFERFRSIVNQVDHDAADKPAVGADGWEVLA